MPAALKLQEEYPDDLQVVFVEVQNRVGETQVEAFTYDRKWRSSGLAMWTREKPFDHGQKGIPAYALLDDDGKVLRTGITTADHHEIVKTIEQRVKERAKGPDDAPSAVAKLWKEFRKGKAGKALAGAEALVEDPGKKDPEQVVAAAKAALETWRAELSAEIGRASWAVENGHFDRAEEVLGKLSKSLGGHGELADRVAELQEKLKADDLKAERAAAAALAKVEAKLNDKGIDASHAKALQKVLDEHAGTKAAVRAEHLLSVVEAGSAD